MKEENKIAIPIFTSRLFESPDPLFQVTTFDHVVKATKDRIAAYNTGPDKKTAKIYNTLKQRVVENIEVTEHSLGDRPMLLLKITAYETNLTDVFVETDERFHLMSKNKVGSENNIVLLYPDILGLNPENFAYRWIAFVYADPTKERADTISICKLVLNKVLGIPMQNVKLPSVMDELRRAGTIDELAIKFYTVENDLNEVDLRYKTYVSRFQTKKQKDTTYSSIPFIDAAELLESNDTGEYKVKEVKVTLGKKELKYRQDLVEAAQNEVENLVEEIFNESIPISSSDFNRVHEVEFVIEKLKPVVQRFISDHTV